MSGDDWWWDGTWNPVGGCSYVSPGCKNCFVPFWLESHTHPGDAGAVQHGVTKRVNGKVVFNDKLTVLPEGHHGWTYPLKWPGVAHPKLGDGRPSLLWAADLTDLFHEDRSDEIISRVISMVAASPHRHICLLLTKRTRRMADFFAALAPRTVRRWQRQIWLGFSAEDQEWFDRRWPDMRRLAAAGWFTFVSIAPMLGPIILPDDFLALGNRTWVIVSGEQRVPGTRPRVMKRQWVRSVRAQCRDSSVPLFVKQMSSGAAIDPDLYIKEFPSVPPL
jgi:protein gp37